MDWQHDTNVTDTHTVSKKLTHKGQILLMSQIVTLETKVNLWEFVIAKVDITFIVVQNGKHLASFVNLILTSEWEPTQ